MNLKDSGLVKKLIDRIKPEIKSSSAIALDFDGVCKLFTEHKHQIMSTLLFLHIYEFQRVTLEEYRKNYGYINFFSPDYAGKARFLCVNALANFLSEKGCDCKLPGLNMAVKELESKSVKVNTDSLAAYTNLDDVQRILNWSKEVDIRVSQLTEIRLTPGIKEHILDVFKDKMDFYLVSTATESSIRKSMERENIFYITMYLGQETASKSEALTALINAGYKNVFMFGDSIEDSRASCAAKKHVPSGANLFFIPVIPGKENYCFSQGSRIIKDTEAGTIANVTKIIQQLESNFKGKEAGSQWGYSNESL